MKIDLRVFALSKSEQEGTSQDFNASSPTGFRYAVADGVSRSYHPEITAQALCQAFVSDSRPPAEWVEKFDAEVLPQVSEIWNERTAEFEQQMMSNPSAARYIPSWRQSLPMGSSTFAGITVNPQNKTLDYCILGDSTLFLIPADGSPFTAICSRATADGDDIEYDNHPDCVSNDSHQCQGQPSLMRFGQWACGTLPLRPGFVGLLTDGAAKWLQQQLRAGADAASALWHMRSHDEFIALARNERKSGEMDDDLTILLLKVSDSNKPAKKPEPIEPDPYEALFSVAWIYPFYIDE